MFVIPTKRLKNTTFNINFPVKFYTFIKKTIKNNISHQSFQFFLRLWNLDQMNFKCSLVYYDNVDYYDFFRLKNVLPLNIYWGYVFF